MNIKKYILLIILCFFQVMAWGNDYKIGDVITFPDGSKGIVFWLDPNSSKGWAVAFDDIACPGGWGPSNTDIPGLPNFIWGDHLVDIDGYNNTKIIRDFVNNNPSYAACLVDFDNGWYLPAAGQLYNLFACYPFIEPVFASNGATPLDIGNDTNQYTTYWSSTEGGSYSPYSYASFFCAVISNAAKHESTALVRAIRDFYNSDIEYDPTLTYLWNTGSTDPFITVTPTETTTYTVTVTSEAGCEATDSKTIIVNNVAGQIINDSICEGEVYIKHGFNVSTPGAHSRSIIQDDCTVPITLNLTVNTVHKDTIRDVICLGDSYAGHGFNITPQTAGSYSQTFHYTTQKGCDSLITVELEVMPSYQKVIGDTICQGTAYSKNGFNLAVQNDAGLWTDTLRLSTTAGCDSLIILKLLVNKKDEVTLSDQVCYNQPYSNYGFSFPPQYTSAMLTDTKTLSNKDGCDSIVTINVKVTDKIIHILNTPLCDGDSVFFKGSYWKTSQSVSDTLTAIGGCDSIVTLNLTVHPVTKTHISDSIYLHQSYNKHGFTLLPQHATGIVRDTVKIPTLNGCNDLVMLSLKVMAASGSCVPDTTSISDVGCEGQYYDKHGFALNLQTDASGKRTFYRYLYAHDGCDSIVALNMTINRAYNKETKVFIEKGFPVTINGKAYYKPETIVHTYQTTAGCDSTVTTVISYADGGIGVGDCDNIIPDKYFSPNDDGANDYWTIKNIECYEHKVYIYDRFGKLLVYYPDNFEKWDGMHLGKPMPSTDYWYLIELKGEKTLIGHFTLVR